MAKKSKISAEDTENVAPAEQMESQDAAPVKKKSKKHSSSVEIVVPETNGTDIDGNKKDKKKRNKGLTVGDTMETVGENPAEEKKSKRKRKNDHEDAAEGGAQQHAEAENGNVEKKKSKKKKEKNHENPAVEGTEHISSNDHAEVENGNGEEKRPKKKRKNQQPSDATEEDEQLFSFKKPSKKRSAEQEKPVDEEDEVPPAKVSKADSNVITAGTTIDQITGIKLNKKKGKRAKRREKQAMQIEEKRQKSKKKDRDEMHKYLQCWSTNRDQWKFHKQTQIHVQEHVFDEVEINADLWPIALEYLGGSKGSSKELLVKRAKSIIQDGDAKAAAANGDETWQASSKYERARELLQFLG